MQRIMNDPDYIVDEMVEGFLKNHKDLVEKTANPRVLKSRFPTEGRVAVVTGGGSGHKPAFIGYCGENLCDAVAIGEILSLIHIFRSEQHETNLKQSKDPLTTGSQNVFCIITI